MVRIDQRHLELDRLTGPRARDADVGEGELRGLRRRLRHLRPRHGALHLLEEVEDLRRRRRAVEGELRIELEQLLEGGGGAREIVQRRLTETEVLQRDGALLFRQLELEGLVELLGGLLVLEVVVETLALIDRRVSEGEVRRSDENRDREQGRATHAGSLPGTGARRKF